MFEFLAIDSLQIFMIFIYKLQASLALMMMGNDCYTKSSENVLQVDVLNV